MKPRSSKNKGQRLQKQVVEAIRELLKLDKGLTHFEGDVQANPMGNTGVDIKLSPKALKLFPYSIEVKNQEKWSIASWWKQAVANTKPNTVPLLMIGKNRHETLVIMSLDSFTKILSSDQRAKNK